MHSSAMKEINAAIAAGDLSPAVPSGCPVDAIREIGPDGSEVLIGGCGFMRMRYGVEISGLPDQEKLNEHNASLPPGDPNILYSFGGKDSLSLSHG
jgi:hypothetical protein